MEFKREIEKSIGHEINGREKMLLFSHGAALSAFASNDADPERPVGYNSWFFNQNAEVTPFCEGMEMINNEQELTFVHGRPEKNEN